MAGVSKSTEKLVNVFVCVGAAVVIFGAWQKITHQTFADFFADSWSHHRSTDFLSLRFLTASRTEMHALAEALPKTGKCIQVTPSLNTLDKMMQEAISLQPT